MEKQRGCRVDDVFLDFRLPHFIEIGDSQVRVAICCLFESLARSKHEGIKIYQKRLVRIAFGMFFSNIVRHAQTRIDSSVDRHLDRIRGRIIVDRGHGSRGDTDQLRLVVLQCSPQIAARLSETPTVRILKQIPYVGVSFARGQPCIDCGD